MPSVNQPSWIVLEDWKFVVKVRLERWSLGTILPLTLDCILILSPMSLGVSNVPLICVLGLACHELPVVSK
jgi:hypothetical protein